MLDTAYSLATSASPLAFLLFWVPFSFCVGSFLSVVGYRLPKILDEREAGKEPSVTLSFPASHCPTCAAPLRAIDNIPVLGWLANRGRCRHCKTRISPSYLVLECVAGVWGAWCAWKYSIPLQVVAWSLFGWYLLTCAWVDAQSQWLPDVLSLGLLWTGLMFAASGYGPLTAALSIGCAATTWAALTLLATGYEKIRGTVGLAGGDIKLLAAIGAWTGLAGAAYTGTAAFGLLIVYALATRNKQAVALGPCIAVAAVGWLLYAKL